MQLSAQSGKRAVIQLNDNNEIIRIYESMTKVSKVGVSSWLISDVARFKWKYADEWIKNNEL